jgi:hypothetical protein
LRFRPSRRSRRPQPSQQREKSLFSILSSDPVIPGVSDEQRRLDDGAEDQVSPQLAPHRALAMISDLLSLFDINSKIISPRQ